MSLRHPFAEEFMTNNFSYTKLSKIEKLTHNDYTAQKHTSLVDAYNSKQ